MDTSIRDRVRARLKAAKFENWTLVAHQMAGRNAVAAVVLMHLIDALHEQGAGTTVKISNDDWRRLYDFGRTRLRHAGEELAPAGVTYLNHIINTWKIDEAAFWTAFEAALELCKPDLSETDTPAQNGQGDPVQNVQGDAGDEGEDGADGVRNEPLILREREKGYIEIFSAFRLRFGGNLQGLLDRLIASAVKLGESVTRAVVGRCMNAGGRTWNYVATSLENEAVRAEHGRQLALMPAVEVPRAAKPKNDLRIVTEAPAATWNWSAAHIEPEPKKDLQPAEVSPEAAAWELAAEQMRLCDRAFEDYLHGSRLVRADSEFVVEVRTDAIRERLQTRLYRFVDARVRMALGRAVPVRFEVAG